MRPLRTQKSIAVNVISLLRNAQYPNGVRPGPLPVLLHLDPSKLNDLCVLRGFLGNEFQRTGRLIEED
jgi:hypothetical protein